MQRQFGASSQPNASVGTIFTAVVLSLGLGWALSYALGSIFEKKPKRLGKPKRRRALDDDIDRFDPYEDDDDFELEFMPAEKTAAMAAGQGRAGRMVEGVRRLPWGEYGHKARAGAGQVGKFASKHGQRAGKFARTKAAPWAQDQARRAGQYAQTTAAPWAKAQAKRAGDWSWEQAKRGYKAVEEAPYSDYRRAVESKLDRAEKWVAGGPPSLPARMTVPSPPSTFGTRPTLPAPAPPAFGQARSKTWVSPGTTLIGDEPGSAVPNRRRRGKRGKRGEGGRDSKSAGSVEGRARAYLSDIVKYSRSTDMEYLDPRRVISMAEKGMKRAFGDKKPAAGRLIQKKLQGHPANVSHALLMFATNEMPGAFDEAFTQRGPGRDRRPRTEYKRSKLGSRGRSARTYGRKTSKRKGKRTSSPRKPKRRPKGRFRAPRQDEARGGRKSGWGTGSAPTTYRTDWKGYLGGTRPDDPEFKAIKRALNKTKRAIEDGTVWKRAAEKYVVPAITRHPGLGDSESFSEILRFLKREDAKSQGLASFSWSVQDRRWLARAIDRGVESKR